MIEKLELRYQMVMEHINRKVLGLTVEQICSKYRTTRKTLAKWIKRFLLLGKQGLNDRSREPIRKPRKTPKHIEDQIARLKIKNPKHGPKRMWHRVKYKFKICATTIYNIWVRRGIYELLKPVKPKLNFYEYKKPNQLWHIDITRKRLKGLGRFYLIAIIDDYSRKILVCDIYRDMEADKVVETVNRAIREYGKPEAILSDNGKQFLSAEFRECIGDIKHRKTRTYNPKCNGKIERWFRTLKEECINMRQFKTVQSFRHAVRRFVREYNTKRMNMGIGSVVPDTRYYQ